MDPLEDLGFIFKDNRLCNLNGDPFDANDPSLYDRVAEAVQEKIYRLMEKRGLQPVPLDIVDVPNAIMEAEKFACSFVYMSEDAQQAENLLILIHGSGAVRAGVWSRRVIINHGLKEGSQLPYIDASIQRGFGIVVMNTNFNSVDLIVEQRSSGLFGKKNGDTGYVEKRIYLPGSQTPTEHAKTVWKKYIKRAKAKRIAIVAHSYGGCVVFDLASEFAEDFKRRVAAICLTDSVHRWLPWSHLGHRKHLMKISRHWVASSLHVDTPISCSSGDVECVSAGDQRHEWTSHSAFDSVFRFIDQKFCIPTAEITSLMETATLQDSVVPTAMSAQGLPVEPSHSNSFSEVYSDSTDSLTAADPLGVLKHDESAQRK